LLLKKKKNLKNERPKRTRKESRSGCKKN